MININDLVTGLFSPEKKFILTVDCEGPLSDNDINGSAEKMRDAFEYLSGMGIYIILFITPGFADCVEKELLRKILKTGNVMTGLHIHVEDLPDKVYLRNDIQKSGVRLLSKYDLNTQRQIIDGAIKFLEQRGIDAFGFRGGFFSINDDTVSILKEYGKILFESHNVYREQYDVKENRLHSLPVLALDDYAELRIERFPLDELIEIYEKGYGKYDKLVALTHSMCFKDEEFVNKVYRFIRRICNVII